MSEEVPELTKIFIVLQGKNAMCFSNKLLQKLEMFAKYINPDF